MNSDLKRKDKDSMALTPTLWSENESMELSSQDILDLESDGQIIPDTRPPTPPEPQPTAFYDQVRILSDVLLEPDDFDKSLSQLSLLKEFTDSDKSLIDVNTDEMKKLLEGMAEGQGQDVTNQPLITSTSANGNGEGSAKQMIEENLFPENENVTLENWPGSFRFQVVPACPTDPGKTSKEQGNKALYCPSRKKLFCKKEVNVAFQMKVNFSQLNVAKVQEYKIRAFLAFDDQDIMHEPVLRCYDDKETERKIVDKDNQEALNRIEHLLRAADTPNNMIRYFKHPKSGRCFVLTPLSMPEKGTKYVIQRYLFTCNNSCIYREKNARGAPLTSLVFTLHDEVGNIVGRSVCKVRVCTAPRRDFLGKHKSSSGGPKGSPQVTKKQPVKRTMSTEPVTATNDDEMMTSSQESTYSEPGEATRKKIKLRSLIAKTRRTLALKHSSNPLLCQCAKQAFSALLMLEDVNHQVALMCAPVIPEDDERSPDAGFQE